MPLNDTFEVEQTVTKVTRYIAKCKLCSDAPKYTDAEQARQYALFHARWHHTDNRIMRYPSILREYQWGFFIRTEEEKKILESGIPAGIHRGHVHPNAVDAFAWVGPGWYVLFEVDIEDSWGCTDRGYMHRDKFIVHMKNIVNDLDAQLQGIPSPPVVPK